MSNNPSSRVVMRIQPSALIFVVIMFVIGAMMLMSNNIDPKALQRAQFSPTPQPSPTLQPSPVPVDAFAFKNYKQFKSPDGLVQLEYPDTWDAQIDPNNRFSYAVGPTNGSGTVINLGFAAPVTPQDAINRILQSVSAAGSSQRVTNPVTIAGLKGLQAHQTVAGNAQAGQPSRDVDIVALALDNTHLFVLISVVDSNDWPKMKPVVDHATSTLKIDSANAISQIDAALATPQATGAATQPATPAATAVPQSTGAATQAATAAL